MPDAHATRSSPPRRSSRAHARAALDRIADRFKGDATVPAPSDTALSSAPLEPGSRVTVGTLGLEGVVIEVHGRHAEVDVRGKRLRAALHDLQIVKGAPAAPKVSVNVDLQPRQGLLSELNVIGADVDEALARLEKFLDASTSTDLRELRIIHGHGTGTLRRAVAAYLTRHPLVERFETAPQNQGGGGATVVVLKD